MCSSDLQRQLEAFVPVDDVHRRGRGRAELHYVPPQALYLYPETRTVGDDEPEVADLRQIDARVVHLVDDATADGEP